MITINNDIRRILKHLLATGGKVGIDSNGDTTKVFYCDANTYFIIAKSNKKNKYIIEFLDSEEEGQGLGLGVCFTSQSSVINFLKNNFLR